MRQDTRQMTSGAAEAPYNLYVIMVLPSQKVSVTYLF